ncbi:MAG: hypothetical protein HY960_03260 [Ignavibacteriae bacterium]|nr:hypothetical protein [Ignavibacteriota bacterium]
MNKNIKIESKYLLLVEGKDECNFFDAFLSHLRISGVQVVDIGGKDNFLKEFPALTLIEGFSSVKRLGFVRDAETNQPLTVFSSICNILQKHKLPIPINPNAIMMNDGIYVGVFIMPDNKDPGMLENLCLQTISSDSINECIDTYIGCVQSQQREGEKLIYNDSKARVQAYLASRSPIVNSLGLGAQKGYWNFDHECFDGISKFLKLLFL